MLLAIADAWTCGPLEGNHRVISGVKVTFKILPIKQRYDLAMRVLELFKGGSFNEGMLADPEARAFLDMLVDLSDATEEMFDEDLMVQIPVALSCLEANTCGFFDYPARMSMSESMHKAVRKAFKSAPDTNDDKKIGPNIAKYWFLWRPVMADICTYQAMFIDEAFSFTQIHELHEMMDVKQFNEIVASHVDT